MHVVLVEPAQARNQPKLGVNFLENQHALDDRFYLTCIVSIERSVKLEIGCFPGCLTLLRGLIPLE